MILTSVNGVDALFERMADRGLDARALAPDATVVAIGPATAERLAGGVRADLVPDRFVAEGVLEALADRPMAGARALVARARGRGRARRGPARPGRGSTSWSSTSRWPSPPTRRRRGLPGGRFT